MPTFESIADEIPAALPLDEHNKKLVSNVHPPDWVNPEPEGRYNMVVVGGGTAGLVTAAGAAGLGAKVALVERHLLGGDCLNVGCVPSKALIRSARAWADVRDAHEYGVYVPEGYRLEFPKVMERMRKLRSGISPHDSAKRFTEVGVDVFIGSGKFTSKRAIEVGGKTLNFSKACIATGARASGLPIPGLAESGALTNETVFSLTELPRRLAVIGAGPIGVELAQSFARFGAKVTLLESDEQILIREDRDAAVIVQDSLIKDGVELICCTRTKNVRLDGEERVLTYEAHGQEHELRVDQILVGAGRAPNVENMGLEEIGVEFDKRAGVKVDDQLRTTAKNIYAAGDVCFPFKFTHTADAMARIVITNALFFGSKKSSALTIPWCTYSDPEIAHVGLYEHEAKERGIEIDSFKVELSTVDRAILEGDDKGFLKVHVKKGTDEILGATLVSRHAGESISELTLAITAKVGLGTIANTIHPYPTEAEVIKKAGDAYNRTRLTPFVKGLFDKILAWRR